MEDIIKRILKQYFKKKEAKALAQEISEELTEHSIGFVSEIGGPTEYAQSWR